MLESILSRFGLTADTLLADPALWLCATLLAYAFGMWVYKKSGYKTICTPLLVAIVLLVVTLEVTGTDYKTYINGGQHINFLLGPATVALAVPLYEQRLRLAKMWVALTCGLVAGGTVAIVSAVLIAGALGASPETMISLAPKSVTVPIAMAVSEHLGGIPALTAALVVITGVVGSLMARSLLGILREKDDAVRGFSKPDRVFHHFHSRSEGGKGEVTFSLRPRRGRSLAPPFPLPARRRSPPQRISFCYFFFWR